jgi:hypothetical protein
VSETTQADADYRREVRRRLKRTAWIVVLSLPLINFYISAGLIMRHRPVCSDLNNWLNEGNVYGEMTQEFEHEFLGSLYHRKMFSLLTWRREAFITLSDWWDYELRWNFTNKAIYRLVAKRHGIEPSDVWEGKVRFEGFSGRGSQSPTCEGVREIAIVGGKWSVSGPPMIGP